MSCCDVVVDKRRQLSTMSTDSGSNNTETGEFGDFALF